MVVFTSWTAHLTVFMALFGFIHIMGACTIGMGVIDMLAHMYLRGKNAAVHITLLRR